jgi:hypothetical protein
MTDGSFGSRLEQLVPCDPSAVVWLAAGAGLDCEQAALVREAAMRVGRLPAPAAQRLADLLDDPGFAPSLSEAEACLARAAAEADLELRTIEVLGAVRVVLGELGERFAQLLRERDDALRERDQARADALAFYEKTAAGYCVAERWWSMAAKKVRRLLERLADERPRRGVDAERDLGERRYSDEERAAMAERGEALPVRDEKGEIIGGRFPIADEVDLRNAIRAFGRAKPEDRERIRQFILHRARALGAVSLLPKEWQKLVKKQRKLSLRERALAGDDHALLAMVLPSHAIQPDSEGDVLLGQLGLRDFMRDLRGWCGMAVGETQLPQLLRGKKKRRGKRAKAKAGSLAFTTRVVEAAVARKGRSYEATILREGPGNASDSNYYTREALERAVHDGLFEGLQCYANHPTPSEERERPERDVRQLIGHFREARFIPGSPAEVRARFVPIDGPGYEWVRSLIDALDAPKDKPLVGISIDGRGEADGTVTTNGRQYHKIRRISHLGSADLVTRAGAGGRFHRRLSEAMRQARKADPSERRSVTPRKLQRGVRKHLRRLERGLRDSDERKAQDAIAQLYELAGAKVKRGGRKKAGADQTVGMLYEALRSEHELREAAEQRVRELESPLEGMPRRAPVPVFGGQGGSDSLLAKLGLDPRDYGVWAAVTAVAGRQVVLSEATDPHEFFTLCMYNGVRDRDRRTRGDVLLLDGLASLLSRFDRRGMRVRDLPEREVLSVVGRVEAVVPGWSLSADGENVFEALDSHFEDVAAAGAAYRAERDRRLGEQRRHLERVEAEVGAVSIDHWLGFWGAKSE